MLYNLTPHLRLAVTGRTLSSLVEQLGSGAATTIHYSPSKLDISQNPDAVIAEASTLSPDDWLLLEQFTNAGGSVLIVNFGKELVSLPDWFGIDASPVEPFAELRVLFTQRGHPAGVRIKDAFYATLQRHEVTPHNDNVEVILYADWRYTHIPVWTTTPHGQGQASFTWLADFNRDDTYRLYNRILRASIGKLNQDTLGIGLLGYSPAVGQLHGQGAMLTDNLELRGICDLNPDRLNEASQIFSDVSLFDEAAKLAADPNIDLIIVTTPPNSHAKLSIQMLEAGKHVICEKPLAFTRAQVDEMTQTAAKHDRLIACHQNRRWDVDYLAVKQAVRQSLIGDVFYMETFVGSYNHPCGFWHSEERVSGGTTYDWGAHYLDWMLDIIQEPVTQITCTRQNRVWHDITNADQERIQVRFQDGKEADFTHSDIAAIPKPKWYLLGTEGAIVGYWQYHTAYQLDSVLYFNQEDIPTTELPPELVAKRRTPSGTMEEQKLTVPEREDYGFHKNLANHLLMGEPLTVPVEHTARVVSVLEAAAKSAQNDGKPEVLHV